MAKNNPGNNDSLIEGLKKVSNSRNLIDIRPKGSVDYIRGSRRKGGLVSGLGKFVLTAGLIGTGGIVLWNFGSAINGQFIQPLFNNESVAEHAVSEKKTVPVVERDKDSVPLVVEVEEEVIVDDASQGIEEIYVTDVGEPIGRETGKRVGMDFAHIPGLENIGSLPETLFLNTGDVDVDVDDSGDLGGFSVNYILGPLNQQNEGYVPMFMDREYLGNFFNDKRNGGLIEVLSLWGLEEFKFVDVDELGSNSGELERIVARGKKVKVSSDIFRINHKGESYEFSVGNCLKTEGCEYKNQIIKGLSNLGLEAFDDVRVKINDGEETSLYLNTAAGLVLNPSLLMGSLDGNKVSDVDIYVVESEGIMDRSVASIGEKSEEVKVLSSSVETVVPSNDLPSEPVERSLGLESSISSISSIAEVSGDFGFGFEEVSDDVEEKVWYAGNLCGKDFRFISGGYVTIDGANWDLMQYMDSSSVSNACRDEIYHVVNDLVKENSGIGKEYRRILQ